MEEGFDVCLGDPEDLDMGAYELWLQGLTIEQAASRRLSSIAEAVRKLHPNLGFDASIHALSRRSSAPEDISFEWFTSLEVQEIMRHDTADEFRLFDLVEQYFYQPEVFQEQIVIQLPPAERLHMVERYYAIDDAVAREIVWRRPTAKRMGKDLDEISEATQVPLRSCRRQVDNLRRAYNYIEDQKAFQCQVGEELERYFLLPHSLACRYAVYVFITFHKLALPPPATQLPGGLPGGSGGSGVSGAISLGASSRRRVQSLTWSDLEFLVLSVMVYWVPEACSIPPQHLMALQTNSFLRHSSTVTVDKGAPAEGLTPVYGPMTPTQEPITPALTLFDNPASTFIYQRDSSLGREASDFVRQRTDSLGGTIDFRSVITDTGATWADTVRDVISVMAEMLEGEHGSSGSWECHTQSPHTHLLQEKVKGVFGVELEKQLVRELRELSRFFNDDMAVEQYKGLVLGYLTGTSRTPTVPYNSPAPGLNIVTVPITDAHKLQAIERKFRGILRLLLALGWGLSQPKELKDLFDDIISKVATPMRELMLQRRELCALFLAMMSTLQAVPILAEKGLAIKKLRHVAWSWSRFLAGVVLCLLRTYSRWSTMEDTPRHRRH